MKTKNRKRMDKTKQFILKVSRVITWVLIGFILPDSGSKVLYDPLLLQLEHVYLTRGQEGLILYVKSLRTNLLNYLSGNPAKVEGIRLTKDGIPKILEPLIRESSFGKFPAARLQIILTILYSTRALKLGKEPDTSPITSAGVNLPTDIGKYSVSF